MPAPYSPTMRPDDVDALRQSIRLTRRETGLPLVFGGQVQRSQLRLTEFAGTRTEAMLGLLVVRGRGLGGVILEQGRPYAVNDYVPATSITHDYDNAVRGEGIRSIAAAPVSVRGNVRGVIYGATRDVDSLGGRATAALTDASRRLAVEIAIRDEVDRRLQLLETSHHAYTDINSGSITTDELQDLRTELRSIALEITDASVRERFRRACERIARIEQGNEPRKHRAAGPTPPISPRELDVLAYVALGCTNSEIAQRLCLRTQTVKAYLRNASYKLGAHSRHDAVMVARRHNLLV